MLRAAALENGPQVGCDAGKAERVDHVGHGIARAQPIVHVGFRKLRHREAAEVVRRFQQVRHRARNERDEAGCVNLAAHDVPRRWPVERGRQGVVGVVPAWVGPNRLNGLEPHEGAAGNLGRRAHEDGLQLHGVHARGRALGRLDIDVELAASVETVIRCHRAEMVADLEFLHGRVQLLDCLALVGASD